MEFEIFELEYWIFLEMLARGTKDYLWKFSWGHISKIKSTSFVNLKGARKLILGEFNRIKIGRRLKASGI